jgi:hypothetical protein
MVGAPVVISSRPGSVGARYLRRHRMATLAEMQTIGALPRFVDVSKLESEARRLKADTTYEARALTQYNAEVARQGAASPQLQAQRVATLAGGLRSLDLAASLDPVLQAPVRSNIAARTMQLLDVGAVEIVEFNLARDLEIYDELVFDDDVSMSTVGHIRLYRGGTLVSRASHFILHATSIQGNLLRSLVPSEASVSILDI